MARIPYTDPAEVPADVGALLTELPDLNLFRMMAHAPTAFPPAVGLGAVILGRLELPAALRELAILQTACRTAVGYEWHQHTGMALSVGVTRLQIEALSQGEIAAECFTAHERCVLAVAQHLVDTGDIPDQIFAAARALFPPRQLVELALVVGYYRMLGGLLQGLRVDLDAPAGGDLLSYSASS